MQAQQNNKKNYASNVFKNMINIIKNNSITSIVNKFYRTQPIKQSEVEQSVAKQPVAEQQVIEQQVKPSAPQNIRTETRCDRNIKQSNRRFPAQIFVNGFQLNTRIINYGNNQPPFAQRNCNFQMSAQLNTIFQQVFDVQPDKNYKVLAYVVKRNPQISYNNFGSCSVMKLQSMIKKTFVFGCNKYIMLQGLLKVVEARNFEKLTQFQGIDVEELYEETIQHVRNCLIENGLTDKDSIEQTLLNSQCDLQNFQQVYSYILSMIHVDPMADKRSVSEVICLLYVNLLKNNSNVFGNSVNISTVDANTINCDYAIPECNFIRFDGRTPGNYHYISVQDVWLIDGQCWILINMCDKDDLLIRFQDIAEQYQDLNIKGLNRIEGLNYNMTQQSMQNDLFGNYQSNIFKTIIDAAQNHNFQGTFQQFVTVDVYGFNLDSSNMFYISKTVQ